MKDEHEIVRQVQAAKSDPRVADRLIEQYLPFIKSETARMTGSFPSQEEDELSIAMFAFYEAVVAYEEGRGSFLKLAALAIKNRILDFRRKQLRHQGHLSLDLDAGAEDDRRSLGELLADEKADLAAHQDRRDAQAEIQHFSQVLARFDLTFRDVAQSCPKQERTFGACMAVLDHARRHPALLEQVERTGKLPIKDLARGAGVDKKTLERHRKYLVAILLAYTNGFEIIRGHLQGIGSKEVKAQ